MGDGKFAYVTVLTNKAYLPGVYVLAQSLKAVCSTYALHVLVPENRNEELSPALKTWGISVVTKPALRVEHDGVEKGYYWGETFFKLRAAELVQFQKIILLDSDMVVLRNLDHLFERPHMSAVAAGRSVIPSWTELNSGLIVLEPSHELFENLSSCIEAAVHRRAEMGLPAGDQDVFNQAFLDWPLREELHLPEEYNTLRGHAGTLCRKYFKIGYSDVYIVHFIGAKKPWDYTGINYIKMFYHGISQQNFAEFRAFLKYRSYLNKMKLVEGKRR